MKTKAKHMKTQSDKQCMMSTKHDVWKLQKLLYGFAVFQLVMEAGLSVHFGAFEIPEFQISSMFLCHSGAENLNVSTAGM